MQAKLSKYNSYHGFIDYLKKNLRLNMEHSQITFADASEAHILAKEIGAAEIQTGNRPSYEDLLGFEGEVISINSP